MLQSTFDTFSVPENLFALVFAINPVATAIMSTSDGRFLHVNQRFLDLVGYGLDEMIGATVGDLQLWDEDLLPRVHQDKQVLLHTHWGEQRTVQVSTALADLDNQGYMIVTLQDISVCQSTEVTLCDSEQQLRMLMQNLPGMAYRCRNDPYWTMEFVNEGCQNLTGYAPHELIDNAQVAYVDLIHPDDRAAVQETVTRCVEEHMPFALTYRLRTCSGAEKWVWERGHAVMSATGKVEALEGFITDITDRKQTEDALHASEDRLRTLLSALPDKVFRLNSAGIYVDFNSPDDEPWLLPPDVFIGQHYDDILPPFIAAQFTAAIEHARQTHHVTRFEYDVTFPDTNEHVYYEARVVIDADNSILSVVRNITEMKQVEMARWQLAAIVEHSDDLIGIATPDEQIVFMNDSGRKLAGLPQVDASLSFFDIYPLQDQQMIRTVLFPAIKTYGRWSGELHLRNLQTGQEIPVDCQAFRIDDPDTGQPMNLAAILRNMSAQKQVEEQLRQSAHRAEALVRVAARLNAQLDLEMTLHTLCEEIAHALHVPVACVSMYNPDDDTLTLVNATGLSKEALIQIQPIQYMHLKPTLQHGGPIVLIQDVQEEHDLPDMSVWAASGIRTILGAGIVREGWTIGMLFAATTDGVRIFTDAEQALLRGIADQSAQAIINAQIMAEVQRERALLAQRVMERTADLSAANAQLSRAARLKDEFLASMSHELRTPLNAILGYTEALMEQVRTSLNEAQIKALSRIEESGRHLLTLINDILDVAKIEAGALNLIVEDVSVVTLCNTCLRLISQSAHIKQIHVTVSIDDQLVFVRCDGRRMKQVLVNLLSNAVKFTPEGGSIGLEVVGDPDHAEVRFTVWDRGIGIAAEHMERLFKPFIQLDSSLSRQYSGTGLGLVLVARMIELHGGSVHVESTPGKGSRFTVTLPWDYKPVHGTGDNPDKEICVMADPPPKENTRSRQTQPLILLAEDNEANIVMMQDYLSEYGYRVIVARNGEEALLRSEELQPDIILMDIQMPLLDGLEATRRIRRNQHLVTTPIIALTALAMPGDRERCLEAGANEYVSKPVKLARLVRMIETYLLARSA